MRPPDPLPQPGDWIATDDGSTFEVVNHCEPVTGHPCTLDAADDEGVYVWLVDGSETMWCPWSDVIACGDMATADAAVTAAP